MSNLDNIRLSSAAKSQLLLIKNRTGIRQWNILSRWAFCLSLAEENVPLKSDIPADSNVEMTWRTFSGAGDEELYRALLKAYCIRRGIANTDEEITQQFRMHLHRGIGYLASSEVRSLSDLLNLTAKSFRRVEQRTEKP